MEENPFPDLRIADFEFLNDLEARERCVGCGKSRMYYCYTCFTALSSLQSRMPHVKLPFKVHVIKHPGEVCGKSTAVHAAVLAPEDVTIYTFPDIPEYEADVRVVLVYPGGNAVTMQDYVRSLKLANKNSGPESENRHAISSTKNPVNMDDLRDVVWPKQVTNIAIDLEDSTLNISEAEEPQEKMSKRSSKDGEQELCPGSALEKQSPATCKEEANRYDAAQMLRLPGVPDRSVERSGNAIDVVVFIDSTWFQVHKISSDPRLSGLQRIELTLHDTKFWRPQTDKPSTYLSTVEAMYYCAREYHECCFDVAYEGQYDNLLFLFCFFYHKIKTLASKTGKKLKAYHVERRKKPKTS